MFVKKIKGWLAKKNHPVELPQSGVTTPPAPPPVAIDPHPLPHALSLQLGVRPYSPYLRTGKCGCGVWRIGHLSSFAVHVHIPCSWVSYAIALDYVPSDYISQVMLFGSQRWSCQYTGQTKLSHSEAQAMEQQALKQLNDFPDYFTKPLLEIIHHSEFTQLRDLSKTIKTDFLRGFIQYSLENRIPMAQW